MSKIRNILRDVGYCSIGAAAVIVETGSKALRTLVRKGEKVLSENQDTVDEIKRKAKEAGEKIKEAVKKAASSPEPAPEAEPVCEEIPVEEVSAPVAPDAIYHTEVPVPTVEEPVAAVEEPVIEMPAAAEKKPEETING